MKIVVDADACPVTALTVQTAKEKNISCILVCDNTHTLSYDYAQIVTVDKGADSADLKIANLLKVNDIVVTQDYGLAALCLSKKAKVLNQNGLIFTEQNIDSLLLSRHLNKKARKAGKRTKGPSKRTPEHDKAFLAALLSLLKEN